MFKIDELANEIYEQNKLVGWWDDPDRCIYQTLQLVSTEIAEATEGERKALKDDHLPHRLMGEVELADALIRVLDLGGRYKWEYDVTQPYHRMIDKMPTVGGMHLACGIILSNLARAIYYELDVKKIQRTYSMLINSLYRVGEINKYDLNLALLEKLEYNKTRADHKRENRAKEGGKKF